MISQHVSRFSKCYLMFSYSSNTFDEPTSDILISGTAFTSGGYSFTGCTWNVTILSTWKDIGILMLYIKKSEEEDKGKRRKRTLSVTKMKTVWIRKLHDLGREMRYSLNDSVLFNHEMLSCYFMRVWNYFYNNMKHN